MGFGSNVLKRRTLKVCGLNFFSISAVSSFCSEAMLWATKRALRVAKISLVVLCFSCSSPENSIPTEFAYSSKLMIKGRDYQGVRFPVYRVSVPLNWVQRDSFPEENLSDTTKPISEFFILGEEDKVIRIGIHNFPTDNIEQRIPPEAQVARWQRQIEDSLPNETYVIPQSFGGFTGLLFRGVGKIKGENPIESTMLAWSLKLGDSHYRNLSRPSDLLSPSLAREMRADITIKAVGPQSLMEAHEEEIRQFVRSFELIEEIPNRS